MNGKIVAERHEEMTRGQAERLFPMLEATLAEEGAVWAELDAIGVGVGPGNFTGIRVSVAAARGLALSLGVPAIGVTGFEVILGDDLFKRKRPCLVSIPFPRDENCAYVQLHGASGPLDEPALVQVFTKDVQTSSDDRPWPQLPEDADILGTQAAAIAWITGRNGEYRDYEHRDIPTDPARAIAEVALEKLRSGAVTSSPTPLYIRPADAAPPSDPPPVILP